VVAMLGVIAACFAVQIAMADPDWGAVLKGFAPTTNILANPEITAVNQDPAGIQGYRVWQTGPEDIWIKPLANGNIVVGVFNHVENTDPIALPFSAIGISGQAKARDLWQHKNLGVINDGYKVSVQGHGAVVLSLTPQQ